MGEVVGGHPLVAPLRTGVAAPLQLALPLGVVGGAAGADAHRVAVDAADGAFQIRLLQGETKGPTHARIEIHAEGVGQAGFVRRFDELAFVEHVDLAGQPPTLAQRPAGILAVVEQRVVATAIGRIGVAAVHGVFGADPVFAVDLRRVAAIAGGDFRADAG